MSVVGREAEVWDDLERIALKIGLALVASRDELGETIFDHGFHWNSPLVARRMHVALRDELMDAAWEGADDLSFETMREFIEFLVWHGSWSGLWGRFLAGRRLLREARP